MENASSKMEKTKLLPAEAGHLHDYQVTVEN